MCPAEAAGVAERSVQVLPTQVSSDAMYKILAYDPVTFKVQDFRQLVTESCMILEPELSKDTVQSFLNDMMYVEPSTNSSMVTTNSSEGSAGVTCVTDGNGDNNGEQLKRMKVE
ncbi:hypothetical protein INT45_005882 [Circinella minor]|uniref:Uncharacterized protein n=1 Tax=Circinella minor TaxID=1195481 RepID=A0A8H7RUB7_9FUNG|nr:hypothetical protein INT45_005882 [Circinella minor]